ncbi:MAG: hypothetical protein L6R38_009519 [Xanthoria sp. 2 TBL-2021]|nr:MAG: hypothetical protein L6R38_009519 [Xanthoria sp. 2 TBL-2021]
MNVVTPPQKNYMASPPFSSGFFDVMLLLCTIRSHAIHQIPVSTSLLAPQMPIHNQIPNNAQRTPRHDPPGLVDLHPAPPPKDIPETLPLQLRLISALCPPRRRKASPRHSSPPASSPPSTESLSPVSSNSAHASTYISFPPPIFHYNGQPRALDTRQYPDLTVSQKVAAQGQKQWREQLAAEEAHSKQEEIEEHPRVGEEYLRKRDRGHREKNPGISRATEFITPILSCPYQHHHKASNRLE